MMQADGSAWGLAARSSLPWPFHGDALTLLALVVGVLATIAITRYFSHTELVFWGSDLCHLTPAQRLLYPDYDTSQFDQPTWEMRFYNNGFPAIQFQRLEVVVENVILPLEVLIDDSPDTPDKVDPQLGSIIWDNGVWKLPLGIKVLSRGQHFALTIACSNHLQATDIVAHVSAADVHPTLPLQLHPLLVTRHRTRVFGIVELFSGVLITAIWSSEVLRVAHVLAAPWRVALWLAPID